MTPFYNLFFSTIYLEEMILEYKKQQEHGCSKEHAFLIFFNAPERGSLKRYFV